MRNGFIFNPDNCVNCNACAAGCILENGWTIHPRNIFTYNFRAESRVPLINVSLACNHCESAVCMEGCPTSALIREKSTGAVILEDEKCIGCRYCQWNCPYDAPKYDSDKKTIAKCHLCYSGLAEGRKPACSYACPTGALSFGNISDIYSGTGYTWFPDKKLNPAIEFTGNHNFVALKIIPDNISVIADSKPDKKEKNISSEISLILFTFLSTLSVATSVSSFIRGVLPGRIIFTALLVLTALVSFFHLGRKRRSWRSVANLRHSPLSREIAAFIVYILISLMAVLFSLPAFLIASGVSGLFFLLLIDSVYIFADRNKSVVLHSGQTLISGLLIVSFFSGIILPFVFIACIKAGLSVHNLLVKKINNVYFGFRFLRLAFLVVPGISLISSDAYPDLPIIFIFLIGELIDRILFYIDFNPMNINTLMDIQLNISKDEKKRG